MISALNKSFLTTEEKTQQIYQIKYASAFVDERYVRGELTRDEYFRMRNDLTVIREVDLKNRVRK